MAGMALLTVPVTVRTPATSANLGPGFDALGLALCLHDEVTAQVTPGGVRVTVSGEGAGELPGDDQHLVVRSMRAAFDLLGEQPAGLELHCVNRIPQARGLGSSSAAIVAGVLLARALVSEGAEHGAGPGPARAVRLTPAEGVRPVVFVPEERGLTEEARAALPPAVPHRDAAHSAGRAALLVHALTARPELLLAATEDRLHQGYRAAGAPATAGLVEELRAAGVPAVVSGAGPSVLVLAAPGWAPPQPTGWRVWTLDVDTTGATVTMSGGSGILEHAERDPVDAGWKR